MGAVQLTPGGMCVLSPHIYTLFVCLNRTAVIDIPVRVCLWVYLSVSTCFSRLRVFALAYLCLYIKCVCVLLPHYASRSRFPCLSGSAVVCVTVCVVR